MSDPASRKQTFKHVDFDLPFIVFVKDSMADPALRAWAKAYVAGERPLPYSPYAPQNPGGIVLSGALPVHLPPDQLVNTYTVSLPQVTVGLRLLRRVNPHQAAVLAGEVPGDRTGRASFSSVRVIFDMSSVPVEHHTRLGLFCNLAVDAVNHFVAHYRVVADRFYVGPVTMSTIQSFGLTTEFDDGSRQTQHFGASSGLFHGMGGAISDEQDDELRAAVARVEPPAIDRTLDLNIRDYLDLQDWRLAVIEVAVAFESWLSRFVRAAYSVAGVSDTDIDRKFLNAEGFPRSVTSIATKLVKEATGFDFAGTREYPDWETKVRDIRNDIVHGMRFDVTRAEARGAYRAMKAAIAAIEGGAATNQRRMPSTA